AVELTVVVGFEGGRRRQLAGQQAAGKRDTREDPGAAANRLGEEHLRGPRAEDVENDLNRLDARVTYCLERLVDPFDADAVMANLAGPDHVVENRVDTVIREDLGGRAVQLQEVDRVDAQVAQAAADPLVEIRA